MGNGARSSSTSKEGGGKGEVRIEEQGPQNRALQEGTNIQNLKGSGRETGGGATGEGGSERETLSTDGEGTRNRWKKKEESEMAAGRALA